MFWILDEKRPSIGNECKNSCKALIHTIFRNSYDFPYFNDLPR